MAKKQSPKKVAKKKVEKGTTKKVAKKTTKKVAGKSNSRNIVIKVGNLNGLAKHVQANIQMKETEERNQIIESVNFWNWLKQQTKLSLKTFKVDFNDPLYRVYPKQHAVTSIIGSISYGGRFNVGGNQVLKKFFPSINVFGAVYYGSTMECAINEYTQGTPLNTNDIKYTLQPAKTFELWDLDKVIQTLSLSSISLLMNKLPIGGGWSNCKVLMPSQILSHWLRSIGGDGLIFTSTKHPSSKIIALFAKDDNESSQLVSIINNKIV